MSDFAACAPAIISFEREISRPVDRTSASTCAPERPRRQASQSLTLCGPDDYSGLRIHIFAAPLDRPDSGQTKSHLEIRGPEKGSAVKYPRQLLRIVRLSLNPRQVLKARRHGYQRIVDPLSTRFQNRTTVGLATTRQGGLYHAGPVWPCTHALYPCIRRPPPRKHQRLPA